MGSGDGVRVGRPGDGMMEQNMLRWYVSQEKGRRQFVMWARWGIPHGTSEVCLISGSVWGVVDVVCRVLGRGCWDMCRSEDLELRSHIRLLVLQCFKPVSKARFLPIVPVGVVIYCTICGLSFAI